MLNLLSNIPSILKENDYEKENDNDLAAVSLAALSAALMTGCGKPASGGKEDNKLNVYNWGEYIDEDVISQFEDETGSRLSTMCLRPTRKCIL